MVSAFSANRPRVCLSLRIHCGLQTIQRVEDSLAYHPTAYIRMVRADRTTPTLLEHQHQPNSVGHRSRALVL